MDNSTKLKKILKVVPFCPVHEDQPMIKDITARSRNELRKILEDAYDLKKYRDCPEYFCMECETKRINEELGLKNG